jgi:hypothetical protein
MKSLPFLFAGVAAFASIACAQEPTPTPTTVSASPAPAASPRKLPRIGVNVSAYFPTSSKTRRTFGSTWTSVGLGLGTSLVSKAKIYPDFALFRQKEDDDRLFAFSAGARYMTPLGKAIDVANPPKYAPYAGLGLNLLYANLDAPSAGTDDKGFGVGANVALGSTLGRTFFVEGRYSLYSRTADFNLSGAQLVFGARF